MSWLLSPLIGETVSGGLRLNPLQLGRELNDRLVELAGSAPTADWDFAKTKSLSDRIGGYALTCSRNSTGTIVNGSGLVETVAVNQARFTHDPTTLESLGLLVEEQRMNLFTYSEQLNSAAWTTQQQKVSVTADQTIAPDGASTADLMTGDGTSGFHLIAHSVNLTAQPYTLTVYAKAGTNDYFQIRGFSSLGSPYANYDLAQGVTGTTNGTSSIQSVGNGWYRCRLTFTPAPASSSIGLYLVTSASAVAAESNSLATSIYLWGAQLEVGEFPTSYIPTTGAQVTRLADVVQATGADFSGWHQATGGTLYAAGIGGVVKTSAFPRWMEVSSATTADRLTVQRYSSGIPRISVVDAGATQAAFDAGTTIANGASGRMAFAYAANAFYFSANGASVTSDTSGTVPAVDRMTVGDSVAASSTTSNNAPIARIAYWPTRLPDATLQAITG